MYIQGIELAAEKWLNKKTVIPGMLLMGITTGFVIMLATNLNCDQDKTSSTTSSVESWKITNTVCAPVNESMIDWDKCFQSTLNMVSINHNPSGWVDLPDGHEYKPLFAYECFGYSNVSALHFGLKPNLFDLMFADILPENGCKWSCDPNTEAECME